MEGQVTAREFGYLSAEVSQLKDMVLEIRVDQKIMKERDDKRQGGLAVLMAMAGILGAGVTSIVQWIMAHVRV